MNRKRGKIGYSTVSAVSLLAVLAVPVQAQAAPAPTTLKVMLWGTEPNQMTQIINKFEQETKSTLNINLDIVWTPQADYDNKLKLELAAGQQMDLVFDAPWMSLDQLAAQGDYYNLDSYFHNAKYPGLKKAFPTSLVNNNEFLGPDSKLHIYGAPLTQDFGTVNIVYYRQDLADKYGIGQINSLSALTKYYDALKRNNPNMTPFVENGNGQYGANSLLGPGNAQTMKQAKDGLWTVPLAPNVNGTAYIKKGKVIAASVTGEAPSSISKFPAPFNHEDYSADVAIRSWHDKGYTESDPITRTDAENQFTSGNAGSFMWDISNYSAIDAALMASVPTAKLGAFVFDTDTRNMVKPSMVTTFQAWNFLSVPKTSKHLNQAMEFVNWLFANQSNNDLFTYGISGKNFTPVGRSKYSYPKGIDMGSNYNFPGYELTWSPMYERVSADMPDGLVKFYSYLADPKTYVRSPLAGFAFDAKPVANQLADPDFGSIASQQLPYQLGMVAQPTMNAAKQQKDWDANTQLQNNIAAIRASFVKQLQAYLKNKK